MQVIIIGAGRMAEAVLHDVVRQGFFGGVTVADADLGRAQDLAARRGGGITQAVAIDANDERQARQLIAGHAVCVSAVPYRYNLTLARAAVAARSHFIDMGGNNDVVAAELALEDEARQAGVAVVPDMGLAPGLVSVIARAFAEEIAELDAIHLRVGGLPRDRGTPFGYALVFSPAGLINEYGEPCLIIRGGRLETVAPLAELETLEIEPLGTFEAFHTSGGASSLPATFLGLVSELDYKTLRYPGHRDWIKPFFDLNFHSERETAVAGVRVKPRDVLIERLTATLPECSEDVVVLKCWATGRRDGRKVKITYELVDYADPTTGLTAMMRCTGFPVGAAAHMAAAGQAAHGAHTPETAVSPAPFLQALKERGLDISKRVED